jgi:basic membrane protein A
MKATKRLLALFLSIVMLFALTACSKPESEKTSTTEPGSSSSSKTAAESKESESPTGKSLKICIITSTGVDDGSFNQNCYEGILAFLEDHPDCSVTDIKEPDYNELIPTVERMVGDFDAFVLPGFNFAAIGDIASANPDKYFLVVDSTITDSEGNPMTLDNVYTMTFKEQESGFFAGIAAALESKNKKVAVVTGMAFPPVVNYHFGFMSGVNYANKHYGANATIVELPSYAGVDVTGANVGGNYVGDFSDEATGKVVGEALLAEGCDILFVAAGAAGNGTFTAVKEHGKAFVIGCDVDQYDDGVNGDSNIILTSVLKVMDINVEAQLKAIYDGTFVGQDALLGVESDSCSYVSKEGRHQLSEGTLEKLAEVYQLVKDGTIVPAANFNGYTPDDFPGL